MTIEEAIFSILGDETGHAIIADMDVHWGVVTAMAAATTADNPEALATIRRWNAEQAEAARALYRRKAGEVADLLASVGRNPEGEDRADGLRAKHEHAVGSIADETPDLSHRSPTNGENSG